MDLACMHPCVRLGGGRQRQLAAICDYTESPLRRGSEPPSRQRDSRAERRILRAMISPSVTDASAQAAPMIDQTNRRQVLASSSDRPADNVETDTRARRTLLP
jgi:hypothetical protein